MTAAKEGARRVLLVAGEASGDMHAARVATELRALAPDVHLLGIGGTHMERAGVEIVEPMRRLSVVGVTEVITRLPKIWSSYHTLKRLFRDTPPDLFIPVDFPGFNLRIARLARAASVPVLYYIGPQIWAWGAGRVRAVRSSVDRMAVIFPFEEPLYRAGGVDAEFVGHPVLDALPDAPATHPVPRLLATHDPIVALLPGSRKAEVNRILPALLDAAARLNELRPGARFVIGGADSILPGLIDWHVERFRRRTGANAPRIDVLREATHMLLSRARVALVASGTVTLEAACLGCPHVIVYRVSPVTWAVARRVVRVPFIGLPNCTLGRLVVPEFLQGAMQPVRMAETAAHLMDEGPVRDRMIADLREVRASLGGPGASARTARMALEFLVRGRTLRPAGAA